MKGSVAIKVFIGFLSLYLTYLVVNALNMELLSAILGQFMGVGVIAIIILFQQEIRKFLIIVGRTTVFDKDSIFKNFNWGKSTNLEQNLDATPFIEAAKTMSTTKTGALIVFSRDNPLDYYVESGDLIDAVISKRLLLSIFDKNSPMHDGAVIIHDNKLVAARCILPVSEQENLPAKFGLRHRAAIGLTEVTNTVVMIVSEETGEMSLAKNGNIEHNLSAQEIRSRIINYMTKKTGLFDLPEKPKTVKEA